MPELPEVETVVRSLRPGLLNRRIVAVRLGRVKLRRSGTRGWRRHVIGQEFVSIDRRGKWILIQLTQGMFLVHLGMTGQLTVGPAHWPKKPHTHVLLDLTDGQQLRFCDPRRFGLFSYFSEEAAVHRFLSDKLGPEPFVLRSQPWCESLRRTRRCLKAVLLDQAVVAGVGNIYADEALFVARLHPALAAHRLEPAAADRLRKALAKVLTIAVAFRGSSIRDYRDGAGEPGRYQEEFRVFGRFGAPCRRCRTPIARMKLAGRTTHFCPQCQRQ
jgi:formamidopyrimidine-DNA glycosylase